MSEQTALRRPLPPDRVLAIARTDAEQAYGDLSAYRLSMVQEADGWHVEYELKDPTACGGGPHYVIDGETGEILHRRYEQ
jgi:hypothetical protein